MCLESRIASLPNTAVSSLHETRIDRGRVPRNHMRRMAEWPLPTRASQEFDEGRIPVQGTKTDPQSDVAPEVDAARCGILQSPRCAAWHGTSRRHYERNDLNPTRISSVSNCGCS